MTRDIEPLLLGYLISGTLLALLQMVCIVMSSAYCAALTRRSIFDFVTYQSIYWKDFPTYGFSYHYN